MLLVGLSKASVQVWMTRTRERNSEDHAVTNMYGQRRSCLQEDNWNKNKSYFQYRVSSENWKQTYNDPTILPPLPFSAARCTPDKTGGSNRRPSCLDNRKHRWMYKNFIFLGTFCQAQRTGQHWDTEAAIVRCSPWFYRPAHLFQLEDACKQLGGSSGNKEYLHWP